MGHAGRIHVQDWYRSLATSGRPSDWQSESPVDLVVQEGDVSDGACIREDHAIYGGVRKVARVDEPRRFWVAEEERGDSEVEFVGQALCEELSVDVAAAFDHEAADAA